MNNESTYPQVLIADNVRRIVDCGPGKSPRFVVENVQERDSMGNPSWIRTQHISGDLSAMMVLISERLTYMQSLLNERAEALDVGINLADVTIQASDGIGEDAYHTALEQLRSWVDLHSS